MRSVKYGAGPSDRLGGGSVLNGSQLTIENLRLSEAFERLEHMGPRPPGESAPSQEETSRGQLSRERQNPNLAPLIDFLQRRRRKKPWPTSDSRRGQALQAYEKTKESLNPNDPGEFYDVSA